MIRVTSFVVASLIAASTAFAAADRPSATLVTALQQKKDVIAGNNLFKCEGTTCVLATAPSDAASMSTCRQIRRSVGELSAFGTKAKPFDAQKLADCNKP